MDSIKGVAVGLVLFFISFPVLWWNEGRVNLADVAKKAVVVKADAVDPAGEGKLVSVTGEAKGSEKIGDPDYLRPGDYVQLHRVVEMYAWVEEKESKTKKKLGGGKRTETTYTYVKEWTEDPEDSSRFKEPRGHENPPMPVSGKVFSPKSAKIGAYSFSPADASLPRGDSLRLSTDMVLGTTPAAAPEGAAPAERAAPATTVGGDEDAAEPEKEERPSKKAKKRRRHSGRRPARRVKDEQVEEARAEERARQKEERARPRVAPKKDGFTLAGETYLFSGQGDVQAPRVGDVRISFRALPSGKLMTLYGEQRGGEVRAYAKDDTRLFRALPGTHEEAIKALDTEHRMITWILRLVGFLMMWFGLSLFFGPINAVLDIIPFLGSAGRFLVGLVLLPVSLLLSSVVIVVSIIAHSPILLGLTVVALAGGGYFLIQRRRAAKARR